MVCVRKRDGTLRLRIDYRKGITGWTNSKHSRYLEPVNGESMVYSIGPRKGPPPGQCIRVKQTCDRFCDAMGPLRVEPHTIRPHWSSFQIPEIHEWNSKWLPWPVLYSWPWWYYHLQFHFRRTSRSSRSSFEEIEWERYRNVSCSAKLYDTSDVWSQSSTAFHSRY